MEVYVVKADADTMTKAPDSACCTPVADDDVPVAVGVDERAGSGCCG
ncbi:hypothetical protein [Embleya sp. NBC_00896]|nr:hypothetical protein OG928_45755 [Embleya sp. NBC_00896]